jgi:hypothetical protein
MQPILLCESKMLDLKSLKICRPTHILIFRGAEREGRRRRGREGREEGAEKDGARASRCSMRERYCFIRPSSHEVI